ncbi:MAG TPA: class I SAM-dependent methyltransferase, partial [Planctomycetaceae bacterium]|nr:class I SAM-dependent methyltransferase [Planctomycetaceae bacterium]
MIAVGCDLPIPRRGTCRLETSGSGRLNGKLVSSLPKWKNKSRGITRSSAAQRWVNSKRRCVSTEKSRNERLSSNEVVNGSIFSGTSMSQINCYDYPQYWDLAFADETGQECEFLIQCSQKYLSGDVKRVLEPGCGGGRLVVALASRGYEVTGYDLSETAIAYLQHRLENEGLQASAIVADMQSFVAAPPVDIAINTVSTFRHLLTEQAALAHLGVMAESIRPAGLYI